MSESFSNAGATAAVPPLSLAGWDRSTLRSLSALQASHWTRRLPDPLGVALQKLEKSRHRQDGNATADTAETTAAELCAPRKSEGIDVSTDLLSTVPVKFAGGTNPADLPDRRGFPRRASRCSVAVVEQRETLRLTSDEVNWHLQSGQNSGKVLDISQTGLCLLLDEGLAKDSEILLRISNQPLNYQVDTEARVVRSHLTADGRHSVHCRTLREFTLAEMQELGRPVTLGHILA